jgi:hypothetical protein
MFANLNRISFDLRAAMRLLVVGATLASAVVTQAHPRVHLQTRDLDPRLSDFVPITDEKTQVESIDDLMHDRLNKERKNFGEELRPEILHMEANYVRTSGTTGEDVLFEASFHLEPRYMSISPEGRSRTTASTLSAQPIMYFLGSARTPLALPVVSNLSKTLKSDAASYTVNVGILPLPQHKGSSPDSIRYYVIIERSMQSNTSDAEVKLERFDKEFSQKADEPVRLELENAPPERRGRILQLEDGSFLDFYEDFARFFTEHIFLASDRLKYAVGKVAISPISQQLSIPYTVGANSNVKIQLLSVVDPEHPLTILDTVKQPASYLAEWNLRSFANGPYRARIIASEIGTGKALFADTINFTKSSPVMVESPQRIGEDTLKIGGKKANMAEMLRQLNVELSQEQVKSSRLDATLKDANKEKQTLLDQVTATQRNSIAGLRIRGGMGSGPSAGTNLFAGVESSTPDLAFDISFGLAYWSAIPYLSYVQAPNVSQIFSSPKSLGLQLSWIPAKPFGGAIEPILSVGYYGVWSTPVHSTDLRSATLLVPAVGFATDFGSAGTGFGGSFSVGETIGLGVKAPALLDVSGKLYWRF